MEQELQSVKQENTRLTADVASLVSEKDKLAGLVNLKEGDLDELRAK